MSAALGEGRRSWRGTPRGTVVRRSRHLWRWLLTALAAACIGVAIYVSLPRPVSRTALLVLAADREERTAPLAPYVAGDRQALLAWAASAGVPASERPLSALKNADTVRAWLSTSDGAQERLVFERAGKASGSYQLGRGDRLLLYIKGHAAAIDVSDGDKPEVRPLLVKSLGESELAGPWYHEEAHVVDVTALLAALARLSDLEILVIFDVVHMNYDPRLGIVLNAFPQAVREAVAGLASGRNLSVVIAQGDGELSVAMPGVGRSAFVDGLVSSLVRQPGDATAIAANDALDRVQVRLDQLNRSGRGSFRQSIQKVLLPPPGPRQTAFLLPMSPPPEGDEAKVKDERGKKFTAAVKSEAVRAAPVPTEVTQLKHAADAVKGHIAAASPPASAKSDAPAPVEGKTNGTAAVPPPPADPNAPAPPTAATAAAPSSENPPLSDLEVAWAARDRLQARYRTDWSPAHVAPRHWRRVEAILAGFDEELLPAGEKPRDPETLANLARDLTRLDTYFGGQLDLPEGADCRAIAEALDFFQQGPAASFQAREPQALDEANQAVKTFAEGFFRAFNYVRLHGQTAALPDGGPLLNDALLESFVSRLAELRNLLRPAGLDEGRLDDARIRELARVANEVEQIKQRVEEELAAYANTTAAAVPSPGRFLRARLLLHSPVLTAAQRRDLRQQREAALNPGGPPLVASSVSFGQRLATNARLLARLAQIALPPGKQDAGAGRRDASGPDALLTELLNIDPKAQPLDWTTVGKRLRVLAEHRSSLAAGADSQPFDLYVQELLVDGRDAHRGAAQTAKFITLSQPLRAPRLADAVEVKFARDELRLPSPSAEPTTVQFALQVTSEQLPPYNVKLELNWDARDIAVTRSGPGAALRNGTNELRLTSAREVIELSVRPRHETVSDTVAAISATARFGGAAPGRGQLGCILPRPDLVELTVAADENVLAARRRSWLPSGQQGGRLKLFANRESTLSLYLTNLSSEDKRVFARLYRVPRSAVDSSGRLFDPKSLTQLVGAAAALDARLAQPGAEASQLPRRELLAQSDEKEPLLLPAGSAPVRVPLTALAPAPPAPPAAGAAAPAEEGKDVTTGLVLVLAGPDAAAKPYVKWIELQIHQPDDLLEIRNPALRDGRLTFRTALKDGSLIDEMGLGRKPAALTWDNQPLPAELRPTKREDLVTAEGDAAAEFSALAGPSVPWPVYLHVQADGYPRGLVSRLSWRGTVANLENLKVNHPPVVQITRVAALAQRASAQPEKVQFLNRPESAGLPYPSPQAIAEGVWARRPGEPLLVRVDENRPVVQIECDLAADIATRYFADDARLRINFDGQTREFAADRRIAMRLAGVEEGALQLSSQVADFAGLQFEPIDVPQDRRIELAAEVSGSANLTGPGAALTDSVTIVLDRTRPKTNELTGQKLPPRPPAMPGLPPPTIIWMQCQASDGLGSGIAAVEFVVGFDVINNGRLDDAERRPPVPGQRVAEGAYAAEYAIEGTPPSESLLIEATATDNVGLKSEPITYRLPLPRETSGGGQRTTFGGKQLDEVTPDKKAKNRN